MDLNILGLRYFLILKRRVLVLFSLTERSLTGHCQETFASILTRVKTIYGYILIAIRLVRFEPAIGNSKNPIIKFC